MRKKILGILAITLVMSATTYASGPELKLGFDPYRSLSTDTERMDMGYTIGGEWMFDVTEDFHLGLGGELRSRVKSSDQDYMFTIPVYLVGKYDLFDDMFYGVGRVGYNVTSEIQGGATGGGHYVAAGLGKDIGMFNVEVLYSNMGYKYKAADESGREDSVGIVFGVKLGDLYDSMTGKGGSEDEPTTMEEVTTASDDEAVEEAPVTEETTVTEDEMVDANTAEDVTEEVPTTSTEEGNVAPMATSAAVGGGAVAATSDDSEYESYTVQEGDTLFGIGMTRNVQWSGLAEKNHIEDPDVIYAGDEIVIPKK